jgi:hypothetical protein
MAKPTILSVGVTAEEEAAIRHNMRVAGETNLSAHLRRVYFSQGQGNDALIGEIRREIGALTDAVERQIKTTTAGGTVIEYIEVTLADIAAANALAHDVLGRSLDELPPQTRRVLAALHGWISATVAEQKIRRPDVRFTRADVRRITSLSDTQCRIHIERLIALEYVLVHRGTRGQSFAYELLYDGQGDNGAPFVAGLIDVDALKNTVTTPSSRGSDPQFAGSSRPSRGGSAAPARTTESSATPSAASVPEDLPVAASKPRATRHGAQPASYLQGEVLPLAAHG